MIFAQQWHEGMQWLVCTARHSADKRHALMHAMAPCRSLHDFGLRCAGVAVSHGMQTVQQD